MAIRRQNNSGKSSEKEKRDKFYETDYVRSPSERNGKLF